MLQARAYQDDVTAYWMVAYPIEIESPLFEASGETAVTFCQASFGADREAAESFAARCNRRM